MGGMIQSFFEMGEFPPSMQQWVNDIFVWVGFGTVIGLLAKLIMPGRDPGGALSTIAMGIGGTVIGSGVCSMLLGGTRVTPISPAGVLVATAGAFTLLFFYRLLGGHYFIEGESREPRRRRSSRRRRTRRRDYAYED